MAERKDLVIGIDLGGTSIRAAVVHEGDVLGADDRKTRADEGVDVVLDRIEKTVRKAIDEAEVSLEHCTAIGIGAPGVVDSATGVVRRAPNLGWTDVPLRQRLEDRLGLPVVVDNDVNVGLLGEQVYGAGRGRLHLVGVWVGTGIGGAVIANGAPHVGGRGAAGEFGHMVIEPRGRQCPCGREGCVEAYASKTAMEAMVRERIERGRSSMVIDLMENKGRRVLSSSIIEEALSRGDQVMGEVLQIAQVHLGLLIANLVNAFDPEMVVCGGGLIDRLGVEFLKPVARTAREHYLRREGAEAIGIVPAALGDDAPTLGAALAARRRLHP